MIYIETKMTHIPNKCSRCKFAEWSGNGVTARKVCGIHKRPLEAIFVREKRNYSYLRPEWCPLKEVKGELK